MPTLLLLTGPRTGTRWPILGNKFSIGRQVSCDAVINESHANPPHPKTDNISRQHALITFADGQWHIEDGNGRGRQSRNGISVNDQKVPFPSRRVLQGQDRISICDLRFMFLADDESTFFAEATIGLNDSGQELDSLPKDRLRYLLELSAALPGIGDINAVLDLTLDHLFRQFPQAERGLVVLRDAPTGPLTVRVNKTPNGTPADSGFSTSVIRHCLEKVETLLGNDLQIQFPESESLGGLPARSLMCAPLWTPHGVALGAIQLDTPADGQRFTPDDMRLFWGVASVASLALGNVRLHRESLAAQRRARDLEVAQQVQRALLPQGLPRLAGYGFFAHYQAAQEVGGDYYDFVPLPGDRLAVLLGDVAGKGVSAALVMAKFGVEARVCLESVTDPAAAVGELNARMARSAVTEKFVTLALAVLEPTAHTVTVVNAGHPSPLLFRASGAVEEVASPESSGLPIGLAASEVYQCCTVTMQPGDQLLLFSDGVSDARNRNELCFRTDGIRAVVGSGSDPCATGERLVEAVRRHSAGCDQADDLTIVCFGRMANGRR